MVAAFSASSQIGEALKKESAENFGNQGGLPGSSKGPNPKSIIKEDDDEGEQEDSYPLR
jgi:hypothetical protein